MARRDRPLYRATDDKMIAGVCAGLGQYFDVDTTLVRVAFIVLGLVGGGGILAYLLLWVLVDPAPSAAPPPSLEARPDQPVIPPATDVTPGLPGDMVTDDSDIDDDRP